MRRKVDFRCRDCGIDTSIRGIAEYYAVHDAVWAAAGMAPNSGMLCIGCLEERLGRQLVGADFLPGATINAPIGCSPRMRSRLRRN
jgi:hypothetical protein